VDDFVSSGTTLETIVDSIRDFNINMQHVGCFFWKPGRYTNRLGGNGIRGQKVSKGKVFIRMGQDLKYVIEPELE